MQVEIVFIGTELLLGQIVNKNAVFLGQELASLGIDCFYQSVVGDNKRRIKQIFENALARANLVITTGGLGPTSDDLTTECWAELFEEEMLFDNETFTKVQGFFEQANKEMSPSNRKLAYRPKTSLELANDVGSAPGIIWDVTEHCRKRRIGNGEKKLVMTFPGVPREMQHMWKEVAVPYLVNLVGDDKKLFYKELKFYGIGESDLAEQVQDLLDLDDPTVAPLASLGECRLRIATKSLNEQVARQRIHGVEEEIKNRAGQYIYGSDADTLETVVGELLKNKKKTIAIAESCTGGLVSKRLTDISGSSEYVSLNLVTYSNESKIKMLNVDENILSNQGAVSEEVALEMARGIKKLAGTDYGLSVTGVAGPNGGTEEKPVGTVYICVIDSNDKEHVVKKQFGKRSREDVRWITSQEVLNILRERLLIEEKVSV